MLKKLFIALVAIMGITATAEAKDTYAHDASVLPKAAQSVIAQNFKSKVSLVKIDKEFGFVSDYEVIMTDGSEITFDKNGNWENVEVSNSKSVPSAFVPADVASYVKKNQPHARIVGIDKERNGYEVQLSNGIEIKFDKEGKFLRYDD